MKRDDEYRIPPPEDRPLPPECSYRKNEENKAAVSSLQKQKELQEKEKKEKSHIKKLTQLLVSMVAGAVVLSGTIQNADFSATAKGSESTAMQYSFMVAGSAKATDHHTVQLTDTQRKVVGMLQSMEPVELSEGIKIEFDLCQYDDKANPSGYGADGMAVSLSLDKGVNNHKTGGELGYKGLLGVEVDLVKNPDEETLGGTDYKEDHMAILGDSVWNHLAVGDSKNFDDGKVRHFVFSIINNKAVLSCDGQEEISADIESLSLPEEVYITFSGATGDGTCIQLISNIMINGSEISIVDEGGVDRDDVPAETVSTGNPTKESVTGKKENSISTVAVSDGNASDPSNSVNADSDTEEASSEPETSETVTCDVCNGAGFICNGSAEADDPEGCHGEDYVDCKACNQTGYQNGKLCSWCKGTLRHRCPSFEFHIVCEKCNGTGSITIDE